MERWHFSPRRYVPHELFRRMRAECGALVLSNVQPHAVVPFIVAARRLDLPIVAHVASWDHTVGKGVIAPFCDAYIVQNACDARRSRALSRHRAGARRGERLAADRHLRAAAAARASTRAFSARSGSIRRLPLVVVMGNTPANTPFEDRFVARMVDWWKAAGAERPSLLFRPHPRDTEWRERFRAALGDRRDRSAGGELHRLRGARDTPPALRLRGRERGTILLDALVNDRPAVCVLYDEGAPRGESFALKNIVGEHYRELAASTAFYRAGVVRRGGRAASSGRSRIPLSSPTSDAVSRIRWSARSTGAPESASSTRSRGCSLLPGSRRLRANPVELATD